VAGAHPSGGVQFSRTKETFGREVDLLSASSAQDGGMMTMRYQTACTVRFPRAGLSRARPIPNARPMNAGNFGDLIRAAKGFDDRCCWFHVANKVATVAMKSQAKNVAILAANYL
jgi:hypothetical protein